MTYKKTIIAASAMLLIFASGCGKKEEAKKEETKIQNIKTLYAKVRETDGKNLQLDHDFDLEVDVTVTLTDETKYTYVEPTILKNSMIRINYDHDTNEVIEVTFNHAEESIKVEGTILSVDDKEVKVESKDKKMYILAIPEYIDYNESLENRTLQRGNTVKFKTSLATEKDGNMYAKIIKLVTNEKK